MDPERKQLGRENSWNHRGQLVQGRPVVAREASWARESVYPLEASLPEGLARHREASQGKRAN